MSTFEMSHFYDFFKRKNEPDLRSKNLHAIHFRRLLCYHPDWKLYKIVLFEYMLQCYKRYGQGFTQKRSLIEEATRLGKSSIHRYMEEFENLGYISVERSKNARGKDFMNRYTIEFDTIKKSLEGIYDIADDEDKKENIKFLKELYDYLEENTYNFQQ